MYNGIVLDTRRKECTVFRHHEKGVYNGINSDTSRNECAFLVFFLQYVGLLLTV